MTTNADASHVKSLRDLLDRFEEIRAGQPEGRFVFRGQPAVHALSTSLERLCRRIDGEAHAAPLRLALKRETFLLREFKRRAHHYMTDLPKLDSDIEWLALMRHHGALTRLLDATYSVAAYFAIQQSQAAKDSDAAVWVFDAEWCVAAAVEALDRERGSGKALRQPIDADNENGLAWALFSEHPVAFVCPINPFRLNERLASQRGLFLAPGDATKRFEDNLNALRGRFDGAQVAQIIIPRASFNSVSGELHKMNVSEATLFPGLDGFARSLAMARLFHEQQRPDLMD